MSEKPWPTNMNIKSKHSVQLFSQNLGKAHARAFDVNLFDWCVCVCCSQSVRGVVHLRTARSQINSHVPQSKIVSKLAHRQTRVAVPSCHCRIHSRQFSIHKKFEFDQKTKLALNIARVRALCGRDDGFFVRNIIRPFDERHVPNYCVSINRAHTGSTATCQQANKPMITHASTLNGYLNVGVKSEHWFVLDDDGYQLGKHVRQSIHSFCVNI